MADFIVKVLENKQIGERYCILRVEKPEGFVFLPGQFAMLRRIDDAANMKRAFSIASAPHESHLEFYIKKFDEGKVSPLLFGLAAGEEIAVSGPFGKFTMEQVSNQVVLIGAGSGVAPLISMARTLHKLRHNEDVLLIHGVSFAEELGYREELEQMEIDSSHFTKKFCISRELAKGCLRGRVTEHLNDIDLSKESIVYLCGPPGMVDSVVSMLIENGFTKEQIKTEKYD